MKISGKYYVCFVALIVLCGSFSQIESKKIGQIPDYNGPAIQQEVGYTTIDEETGLSIFWWLIYSNSATPLSDPLVVWYQGGPGCSGLGGLFSENGPYLPDGNGGMMYNAISWNNFANVLYIEQPCGVGFSYSNSTSDYSMNDTSVAQDNFEFLEMWLQQNPQFQGSQTWLTGESYAGVYIPTVTSVILANPTSQIASQLAGISVGNPVISCTSIDYNAIQFDLFYYHGLVSYIVKANWTTNGCDSDSSTPICGDILQTAINQIGVIDQQLRDVGQNEEPSLDPDNLYQDFCFGNATLEFAVNADWPNNCDASGDQITTYLNRKDVQQLLGVHPGITWSECANIDYTTLGLSMIPHYQSFFQIKPDLKVMIYSGDVDIYTVPFGYTHACLAELEEVPVESWQPWFVNGATAGYVEQFPHYTFATVKGAGHEVPLYQPLTSYNMFYRFMMNGKLTTEEGFKNKNPRMTQSRMLKKFGVRV